MTYTSVTQPNRMGRQSVMPSLSVISVSPRGHRALWIIKSNRMALLRQRVYCYECTQQQQHVSRRHRCEHCWPAHFCNSIHFSFLATSANQPVHQRRRRRQQVATAARHLIACLADCLLPRRQGLYEQTILTFPLAGTQKKAGLSSSFIIMLHVIHSNYRVLLFIIHSSF